MVFSSLSLSSPSLISNRHCFGFKTPISNDLIWRSLIKSAKTLFLNKVTFIASGWTYFWESHQLTYHTHTTRLSFHCLPPAFPRTFDKSSPQHLPYCVTMTVPHLSSHCTTLWDPEEAPLLDLSLNFHHQVDNDVSVNIWRNKWTILLALLRLLLYTLLPFPTWSLYDYSKISKSQFSSHGIHFIPFGTFIEVPKLSRAQLLRLSDTIHAS